MKQPYEFLARWDHMTGVLKGAHVKLYDNVTMMEGDAEAVAVAGAAGFPISVILTAIETGAILAMGAAQTAQVTAETALAAKDKELTTAKAESAAAKAQLATVSAELAAEKLKAKA